MNKYDRLPPEQALAEAARILSASTPRNIWTLCALLSVAEAYAQEIKELLFFPALNHEKVRLLCEAALESKALDYKKDELNGHKLIEALNYASRGMADSESLHLMRDLRGLSGPNLALRVFMSQLGNIQIRYQDPRFHERAGRLIGMLEVLPKSHRHKMPSEFWDLADPVLMKIHDFLEFSLNNFAGAVLALLHLYDKPYKLLIERFSSKGSAGAGHEQRLRTLLNDRKDFQHRFLIKVAPDPQRTAINRFLELFARTTRELRDLRRTNSVYARGAISRRLSPLERYPVVMLGKQEIVIPNLRYLSRNFADIIHFSLWEESIPHYDQVRGGLQELYLHVLLESRLPYIKIVPERPYRRKKQSVKSADLTLVEDGQLILVESKAQRIRVETRLNLTPDNLLNNLEGAIEAIEKSDEKIADLYSGLPEFKDVQEIIDSTRKAPPICVAVLGEEIAMMGEVLSELAESYPNFPLIKEGTLFCVLGIDSFERAVEVAAGSGRKLGELLRNHISESATIKHETPPADEFGGSVDLANTFAVSFFGGRDGAPE